MEAFRGCGAALVGFSVPIGRLYADAAETVVLRTLFVSRPTRQDEPQRPGRSAPGVGPDPGAKGRADAAYQSEFDRWQGLIEFALSDRSQSPDQRRAAVVSLRAQQQAAAAGARMVVMEDEKQKARAARRAALNLLKTRATPT